MGHHSTKNETGILICQPEGSQTISRMRNLYSGGKFDYCASLQYSREDNIDGSMFS